MIAMPVRHFTVDEYHRLAEAGVLHEDERVELLNGQIIPMMPIGPFHGGSVSRLSHTLFARSNGRWITRVQDPVRLGPRDEPEPDLALVHPREDFYSSAHPGPTDILLLIEVADSTLLMDRGEKLPIYARAGIPEVWIVNLPERLVEVYRQPVAGTYIESLRIRPGESLAPAAFPDVAIDTAALLG